MSRREPVTEAQWLMARSLSEGGEPPTRSRIAAALGVHESSVYARAAAENWRPMDFRRQDVLAAYRHAAELAAGLHGAEDGEGGPEDPGEGADVDPAPEGSPPDAQAYDEASPDFLANAGAFVSRQIARIMAKADKNGRLDKGQIDSLISLSRMAERWEAVAMERAKQETKKSDDELAAILKRVNDRIIHLARGLAARMVAEKLRSGGSETEGRLVQ